MEQIISKEELNELMKLEGKVRGMAIRSIINFILKERGEEGLKKFKDAIINLGFSIKHEEIKLMEFYPINLWVVFLLTTKRLFGLGDKEVEEIGKFESKTSLVLRLSMRYFFSADRVVKEAPNMWRKAITAGDIKITEYDEDKKYAILKLKNLRTHPIQCQFFKGYFSSVVQMIIKNPTTCEETKCPHKDDEYHEF